MIDGDAGMQPKSTRWRGSSVVGTAVHCDCPPDPGMSPMRVGEQRISGEIDLIDKEICAAAEAMESLTQRLSGVLRPADKNPCQLNEGVTREAAPPSPMLEALMRLRFRVRSLAEHARSVERALDI